MNKTLVKEIIKIVERTEIGDGDLTTEVVTPYPKFGQAHLISDDECTFAGKKLVDILFSDYQDEIKLQWHIKDGDKIKKNQKIFTFNGKIPHILSRRRILEYLIGRTCYIATKTEEYVKFFEQYSKKLITPNKIVPLYETFDNYAFQIGGGILRGEGLKDSIYITNEHVKYGGDIESILKNITSELGPARKNIKIEIEVENFNDFIKINDMDIDMIHLVNMNEKEIIKIFEKANPKKKPVLHLSSISDWNHTYKDLFFIYLAIEDIYYNVVPMKNRIEITGGQK
ncbi:MAG: hypothetical protein H0Z29_04925 [Candidatus Marinimicrobia bacterium]|nr:hypothetical protein [Candidatus Neomarinimicrobiota bacterium]